MGAATRFVTWLFRVALDVGAWTLLSEGLGKLVGQVSKEAVIRWLNANFQQHFPKLVALAASILGVEAVEGYFRGNRNVKEREYGLSILNDTAAKMMVASHSPTGVTTTPATFTANVLSIEELLAIKSRVQILAMEFGGVAEAARMVDAFHNVRDADLINLEMEERVDDFMESHDW